MKDIIVHNVTILIEYNHKLTEQELKEGTTKGSLHEVTQETLKRLGLKEVADKGLTHMSTPSVTLHAEKLKAVFSYFISLTFPKGFDRQDKK